MNQDELNEGTRLLNVAKHGDMSDWTELGSWFSANGEDLIKTLQDLRNRVTMANGYIDDLYETAPENRTEAWHGRLEVANVVRVIFRDSE